MSIEIKVPALPESVADAQVTTWYKSVGQAVEQDAPLVDIETDKVVLEVVAPVSGVLTQIFFEEGATVTADQILGAIGDSIEDQSSQPAPAPEQAKQPEPVEQPAAIQAQQAAGSAVENKNLEQQDRSDSLKLDQIDTTQAQKEGLSPSERLEKMKNPQAQAATQPQVNQPAQVNNIPQVNKTSSDEPENVFAGAQRVERREKMSRLRQKIAQRLLDAQSQAAMLTTFNEINMENVMNLRSSYKEEFEKKHEIKLGFMSLFTKAVCHALEKFPAVNGSIDGNDIVYHDYCDISIAVSSPRGLVVPVVRQAHQKSLAQIEKDILDLSLKARDGQLSIEEMTGGTFTITNGGVFGSLMSTPILNPPQSAILGMHKIEKRPVVIGDQVVVKPMMYVALSYDHRIIDGRDSVQFLVAVKQAIEEPERLLLNL
jgi:2-oxoglutarate dehydrogenase E2 component (dihydrolipoamide succinyltransferase)